MKIGIFYNPKTNPENKQHAGKIADAIESFGLSYVCNPENEDLKTIDLAITAGGDGTVLYTANLLANFNTPILGINFGKRGYLCEVRKDEIEEAVKRIKENKYRITEKTRIQAEIKSGSEGKNIFDALNEISIGGINRTVHIGVEIVLPQKTIRSEIIGDGLIASTQTGSTAYNINAGGPMLLTEAFSVVANNAFFESDELLSATKSIIVPTDTEIFIRDLSKKASNLPFVISDGQESIKISAQDTVVVKKSTRKNYFIIFHADIHKEATP